MQKHTIIGTAGHIDHGKTSLVKALTGIDTDCLPEEKARGITIDIGFAYWKDSITVIDVPGHEKFIKNMVTGVCTLDFVVLVIASDDGIMPQTREHFEILQLLGIQNGIIVLTKIDLVEKDWIELVKIEIKDFTKGTFLENCEIFEFSAKTNEGLEKIRNKILLWTKENSQVKPSSGIFRLNVDRSFSLKGFGTVVTGTVVSGSLNLGEEITVLPQNKKIKVRGIQVSQKEVNQTKTGDRAALNLANIEKEEVKRGNVVSNPNFLQPTVFFDAEVTLLKSSKIELENRLRVRLQLATKEVFARVYVYGEKSIKQGEKKFAQLRLEEAVVCAKGDKFILRRYSPEITIGGGIIVDANPQKRKLSAKQSIETLKKLQKGTPTEILENVILASNTKVISKEEIASKTNFSLNEVEIFLEQLTQENKIKRLGNKAKHLFFHEQNILVLERKLLATLSFFHENNPKISGIRKAELFSKFKEFELSILELTLKKLIDENLVKQVFSNLALSDFEIQLSKNEQLIFYKITEKLKFYGVSTPNFEDFASETGTSQAELQLFLNLLTDQKKLVWLTPKLFVWSENLENLKEKLIGYLQKQSEISVNDFKDLSQTSRKNAIPLLEFFDEIGLTERKEDKRVLA
ncbi:selenocysteine-specific translation elongation factor [bacterium]|nr:selenocysteine-specific translation elongation factor [bacterium]